MLSLQAAREIMDSNYRYQDEMSRDSAVNVFSSLVLERSNLGFRETTHLPLPYANIWP